MAINFHPKSGTILVCNFDGYVVPEIIKVRPVVVISPNHMKRAGLYTVVPLSTTEPTPKEKYHVELINPITADGSAVWAKCDMVAVVRNERLDRFKISRGTYKVFHLTNVQVDEIRKCVAISIGIDFED
jgi:mRNA interferase MazF